MKLDQLLLSYLPQNHRKDPLNLWGSVEILTLSSFARGVLYREPIFLHTAAK